MHVGQPPTSRTSSRSTSTSYRTASQRLSSTPPDGWRGRCSTSVAGQGSTHGHLGPAALSALIRIGLPGATFAIGINAEHFSAKGFAAQLTDELAAGSIRDLDPKIVDTYLPDSVHYGQKTVIAVFRRA